MDAGENASFRQPMVIIDIESRFDANSGPPFALRLPATILDFRSPRS